MSQADAAPINNFERNASASRAGRKPPRPEMAKRVMDVEEVLAWAVREELPKRSGLEGGRHGPPAYVSPLARMVAVGVVVDNWGREPGFPSAMGPPHPDALLVEQALREVGEEARAQLIDGPATELDLGADLRALGADEIKAVTRALAGAEATVERCAKLGERPFWTRDTVPRPLRHANGAPQIVRWEPIFTRTMNDEEVEHQALVPIGIVRRGDYPSGAYCPLRYDPDPQAIAEERAEYLVWWGTLSAVAAKLSGRLSSIAILSPGAPRQPWNGEQDLGKPPRIFADLRGRVYGGEDRETAAAHRALGLRGRVGRGGAARGRGLPTRIVRTAGRPASTAPARACAAR